jgi:hypothetical protein
MKTDMQIITELNPPFATPNMATPANTPKAAVRSSGSATSAMYELTVRRYPAPPPKIVMS